MSAPEARIAELARRDADYARLVQLARKDNDLLRSHSVDEAAARHGRKTRAAGARSRTR